MSIETKFIIGLLLLMIIGAFFVSFIDPDDTTWSDFKGKAEEIADSFDTISYKTIGTVLVQGGSFLFAIVSFMGKCILWNFCFFEEFRWLQIMLICINIAIFIKIAFDVFRSLKPFGS